jgi:hypothetical protein
MTWLQNGQHEVWLFMKYFGFWAFGLLVVLFTMCLIGLKRHPKDFDERVCQAMNSFFSNVVDPLFTTLEMLFETIFGLLCAVLVLLTALALFLMFGVAYKEHSPLGLVLVAGLTVWLGKKGLEEISYWWRRR